MVWRAKKICKASKKIIGRSTENGYVIRRIERMNNSVINTYIFTVFNDGIYLYNISYGDIHLA